MECHEPRRFLAEAAPPNPLSALSGVIDVVGVTIDDKFRIVGLVGQGAFGTVYEAVDLASGRRAALKLMHEAVSSPFTMDAIHFRREMEIVSGLTHRCLAATLGYGSHTGRPYVVTELLSGKTLAERLLEGRPDLDESVLIVRQLAETLCYVHEHGVIHRDIKPANVFLVGRGEETRVRLVDFGLALVVELKELKDPKAVAGTFGYMSPEAAGILDWPVDERSDLYSLGVVFYELLTGNPPFRAPDLHRLLHQQAAFTPPGPAAINAAVPADLNEIVGKLLTKEPAGRYQSARGLLADLERRLRGEEGYRVGEADRRARPTYRTSLVGRASELRMLQELCNRAAAGRGGLCLIAGEAGLGKSRLVEELRVYVWARDGLFLRGRCSPAENKTPYQPWKDVFDAHLSILSGMKEDRRVRTHDRLRKALGESGGELVAALHPPLADIFGPPGTLVPLEPEREAQRFRAAVTAFVQAMAGEGESCLIFLDDLQWADDASLRLLKELLKEIRDSRMCVIGAYRRGEIPPGHVLPGLIESARALGEVLSEIDLAPLDPVDIQALVASALGQTEERVAPLADRIHRASGGNPFMALSALRSLGEHDRERGEEKSARGNGENEADYTAVPDLSSAIADYLPDLSRRDLDLFSEAATIGKEFTVELLLALTSLGHDEAAGAVERALARQLLKPGSRRGRLAFAHDLYRSYFLERLGSVGQKRLHRKVAVALAAKQAAGAEEDVFALAYHHLAAGSGAEAVPCLLRAAEAAAAVYAVDDALWYLNAARPHASREETIAILHRILSLGIIAGHYDEALSAAGELLSLPLGQLERAGVHREAGKARMLKGDWEGAERSFYDALDSIGEGFPRGGAGWPALAREVFLLLLGLLDRGLSRRKRSAAEPRDREAALSCYNLNWVLALRGRGEGAVFVLLRMVRTAVRLGDSRETGLVLTFLGVALGTIARHGLAIFCLHKAARVFTRIDDEWGFAQALQFTAMVELWRGHYRRGRELYEKAGALMRKIGDQWYCGRSYEGLGFVSYYTGDFQAGVAYSAKYLKLSLEAEDDFGICLARTLRAACLIEMGELPRAGLELREALSHSEARRVDFVRCLAGAYQGLWRLENRSFAGGEEELAVAIELETRARFRNYTAILYPVRAELRLALNSDRRSTGLSLAESGELYRLCRDALYRTKRWPNHYGAALRAMAKCHALHGARRRAAYLFRRSIAYHSRLGRQAELAKSLYEFGLFLYGTGRAERARRQWQQAREIFASLGARAYVERCEACLATGAPSSDEGGGARERLRDARHLEAVLEGARRISSLLEPELLLQKILDGAMELTGAERGALLLYPEEGPRELAVRVVRDVSGERAGREPCPVSRGALARLERERKPLLVTDALAEQAFQDRASVALSGIRSVICAPLVAQGEMTGAIYLDSRLAAGLFHPEDLDVLDVIARQAGVSLDNARLYQRLKAYAQEIEDSRDSLAAWNRELEQKIDEHALDINRKDMELRGLVDRLKGFAAIAEELAAVRERNRLAMDVHDTLGNTMTLLINLLESCKQRCLEEPAPIEGKIAEAIRIARDGFKELKRSIKGLSPEPLAGNSLARALAELAADFRQSGLEVTLDLADLPRSLANDQAFVLYRLCQEAFTNAVRHGKAGKAQVRLRCLGGRLHLRVTDDGIGCDEPHEGGGLAGMEQRIRSLDGSITFGRAPEGGFRIEAEMPCEVRGND